MRAIGQYVVDVFGFEEFREGEVTPTTTTSSLEGEDGEKKTITTVKEALESALESLEYLRKVMMLGIFDKFTRRQFELPESSSWTSAKRKTKIIVLL